MKMLLGGLPGRLEIVSTCVSLCIRHYRSAVVGLAALARLSEPHRRPPLLLQALEVRWAFQDNSSCMLKT